jgi:hypothetical protein
MCVANVFTLNFSKNGKIREIHGLNENIEYIVKTNEASSTSTINDYLIEN